MASTMWTWRGVLTLAAVVVVWAGSGVGAAAQAVAPGSAPESSWGEGWETPQVMVGPVERLVPPTAGDVQSTGRGLTLDFVSVNVPPEGDAPTELAFTPDGAHIIIAHRDSQNLVVFDAATRLVVQVIPLSGSPGSLAISSDGLYAVTANLFEDTASIVDLTTGTETAVVPVGDQPGTARITPDGTTAIIGNTVDSTLSVVDIATATELRRIPDAGFNQVTSWGAWAITYRFTDFVITPDGATIIFPDAPNDRIDFFDIATGALNAVSCGADPWAVALSADGLTAVVSHGYPLSQVTVLDVATQSINKEIPTGASATSAPPITINPEGTKAVIAVQNAVCVVTLATSAVSGNLSTGAVNFLRTTADGQYCVVGGYMGSIVSYATQSIVKNPLSTTTPDALAVSPVDARAATAHALRKEFMEVINTAGSAGYQEGVVPTGPLPEGDKARAVAVTPDGQTAVVINNHSNNATIIDLPSRTITGVADVGLRPGDVAVTPDGARAVVTNLDSTFVSVVNLADASVTNVAVSYRDSLVVMSPDGQYAYVSVVASGDGVWRVNMTTLSTEGPRISTGNMGSVGYAFEAASGVTLSHDGLTLAVCGSFTNDVSVIDTATWAEVARVPVGTFPVRACFSPDDSLIYVSNKNDDTVSVMTNAGSGSTVVDTINVGDQPFELVTNPAGTKLYVANFASRSVSVVDLPANVVTNTIPIPQTNDAGQPIGLRMAASGSAFYVAANGADFHVIDTATETITDTINTGLAPTELQINEATRCAFMPSPNGGDGVSIVSLGLVGDLNCDGIVNNFDITAFIKALTDPAGYGVVYPNCDVNLADVNGDGLVNNFDISPFIDLLTGG
ncbi:MAG: dockerin type I domain-containing protein [Phycisphaerae bacterium]|jgi:YVTN family beta-propeller protein